MSLWLFWAFLLCSLSCSNPSPEEQAANAARNYYHYLTENRPEDFLNGKAGADTLTDDYRRQLLQACRRYQSDMSKKHGGLTEVAVSPSVGRRDTSLNMTYAFLLLTFRDSTKEEIAVPMVETANGKWRMK